MWLGKAHHETKKGGTQYGLATIMRVGRCASIGRLCHAARQWATCMLTCLLWSGASGRDVGDFEELTFEIATSAPEILPIEAMLTSPAPYLGAESGSPAWITRAVLVPVFCGILAGALIVARKLKRSSRGRPAGG